MNVRKMIAVLTLAFALFITVGVNAQDKKAPASKKPAASGDAKPAPKKSSKKGHKKSHKKSGKKSTKKASSGGDTKAPAKTPAKKKS